ncbi:1-phosphatidylinositol-3-phosphate 5-kinase FAB1B-like protein, partial [Tanacetum coccineum]
IVVRVVYKKNVAHRRMTSRIEKPRFLLLGGALEYQRVSNHLSSFDTLLQQEMDHLKMDVANVDAHQPDVLLVEKSVSRYAQEYLLAKDISLVLNIKRPLLELIARFQEEHGTAGQTGKKVILLRGANGDELKKVKHVVQYGVFAAYHLALESSFLADEGASLPELPLNVVAQAVALPDKPSNIERSISTILGFTAPTNEKPPQASPETHNVSMLEMFSIISQKSKLGPNASKPTAFLSSVASAKFDAHKQIRTLVSNGFEPSKESSDNSKNTISADRATAEGLSLKLDARTGKDDATTTPKEEFPPSPSDHQSILFSLSSRCMWKGTACERSHLFCIKYYGNFDKPLGRFLQDDLFDQMPIIPRLQPLVDYLLVLRKTLEKRKTYSETNGLARRFKNMLVELNEYDYARHINKTFNLKEAL